MTLLPGIVASSGTVVPGASHVHTARSDGTGSADEVAAAAARAGLKFLVFTDHGDGTREPDPPQYRSGVLCLDGVELGTTTGHYLAVGLPKAPYPLGGEPRDVVEDVRRLGGFGIVAHPDSPKADLRWGKWDVPVEAIEWLNGDSEWRDETRGGLLRAFLAYPFRPVETVTSLLDRPDATLRRWDGLTLDRPVVGLAGNDAHARLGFSDGTGDPYRSRILIRMPTYEVVFKALSMRVELERPFSGDAGEDAAGLLAALKRGRVYSVVDGMAAPAAFEFAARSGAHLARQGEGLELDGPVRVEVHTNGPPGSTITLVRDGRPVAEARGPLLQEELPPARGVLRVEVRLGGSRAAAPWIVSNPIYLAPPAPAAPPAAPPAVEARRLDVEEAGREWGIERQGSSSGALEPGDGAAIRIRYSLGRDAAPFVAVRVPAGDLLPAYSRVALRASAAAPMRLSLQLRRPDGRDGERWGRSIYLDATPRDVIVRFSEMAPVGATATLAPDMGRVEDLLLVVDTINTARGSSGAFEVGDLRLER